VLEAQPYRVTHDVVTPYVLGRTCAECHSPMGTFFNGAYGFLGSGFKTSDGSTAPLQLSWNDSEEVGTKAQYQDSSGASRTLAFDSAQSTQAVIRSDLLGYGPQRAAALNSIIPQQAGIAIAPRAVINASAIPDACSWASGTQVLVNTPVTVTAQDAQTYDFGDGNGPVAVGITTYYWTTSDPGATIVMAPNQRDVTFTFQQVGAISIALRVTDEERKVAVSSATVQGLAKPPITITWDNVTKKATFDVLPSGAAKAHVYWGDGTYQYIAITPPSFTASHTYASSGDKIIAVYVFDSSQSQIDYGRGTVSVALP